MFRHNLSFDDVVNRSEQLIEEDVALTEELDGYLWDNHALPPVRLTRGSLFDKLHAVMHSFFLEAGGLDESTYASNLASHSAEVLANVGDMGVEFGLPTVLPAAVDTVFPWMPLPSQPVPVSEVDAFLYQPGPVPSPKISFCRALQVSGLQHVLHNATRDLLSAMPVLAKEVPRLKALNDYVVARTTRERLYETCFTSPVGMAWRRVLNGLTHAVYEPRWGSLSRAVADAVKCESALRWGWDVERILSLEKSRSKSTGSRPALEEIGSTIISDYFWFAMKALDALGEIVLEALDWIQGCPCHTCWKSGSISDAELARWKECVLRTMRLPELCAGEFLSFVRDVSRLVGENLLLSIPAVLSADERDAIMADFWNGQAHLLYTLALKLAPYEEPPLLLPACAHHDKHIARKALKRCFESNSTHPLIQELQAAPLRDDVDMVLSGFCELEACPTLEAYVGAFKFIPVDETPVESLHARLERTVANFHNRSMAYDSLQLRMWFFRKLQARHATFIDDLAGYLSENHSPGTMATALGFGKHPGIPPRGGRRLWDKAWAHVVYRSDVQTLFHTKTPALECRQSGVPRGRRPWKGIPRNDRNVNTELLRLAAIEALIQRAKTLSDHSDGGSARPVFFAARIHAAALSTASSIYRMGGRAGVIDVPWLEESHGGVALSAGSVGPWALEQRRGGQLFFSVVSTNPSDLRAATTSSLTPTDVAVKVHRVLSIDRPFIWLSASSVNVDMLGSDGDVRHAALILSLNSMDLETLEGIRLFRSEHEMRSSMDLSPWDDAPETPPTDELMRAMAAHFLFEKEIPDHLKLAAVDVLRWLRGRGALESTHGRERLRAEWSSAIISGWYVRREDFALKVSVESLTDNASRYELMLFLEGKGWQMRCVKGAAEVHRAFDPYSVVNDSPKVWFVKRGKKEKKGLALLVRPYLLALATADVHLKPVPHLATQEVYLKLLDASFVPKAKRRRVVVEYVDVDEWSPVPPRQVVAPARRKRSRVGGSSDGRSSSSSSSNDGSDSSHSGSSSSKSGSGKTSDEDASGSRSPSPQGKLAPAPAPKATAAASTSSKTAGSRSTQSRQPFGLCWMQPRKGQGGEISGWFMHCTHPDHCDDGVRCTKEVSVKVAGSSERAQLLLKAWIVLGRDTGSRGDHRGTWPLIMSLQDGLPDDISLESMAPRDWVSSQISSSTEGMQRSNVEPSSKRGKHRPSKRAVPPEVLAEAEAMWLSGELPKTTRVQWERSGGMNSGLDYVNPPRYTLLLRLLFSHPPTQKKENIVERHGIIGPNLPAPTGYVWRAAPGRWILASQGG